MGRRLTVKFLIGYAAFGLFILLVITFVTSWMIERNVERRMADMLYEEAYHLADIWGSSGTDDHAFLAQEAAHAAIMSGADVWFILPDGSVALDTAGRYEGAVIPDFDPAARGRGIDDLYTVGTFYSSYSENVISVMTPVMNGHSIRGFAALHAPASQVRTIAADSMRPITITGIAIYIFSFLFLVILHITVVRPLAKITRAAEEFAKGNLNYRIDDISKYDEMGTLAATLNYMSDELRDMEESQRRFVSNISHDFRSPLTSIKGYLEAMLDGTIPPEKHEHYLNVVLAETERLHGMADSTLSLRRVEETGAILDITEFDVNDVIRRTAASFESVCVPRGIVLDLTFDDEELYVLADEPKIEQVLHNLIDNAIKFTDDETDIWIETYAKGGKAFISVKDAGCGISTEDQKKIWNRFYKGDSSRGEAKNSTGLGLAICREIIHHHGQTIDVISTEGVGSEFIFTLRAAERDDADL